MSFIEGKHIVVTGGAGFLGRAVCAELELFSPAGVFVPLSKDYDLREKSAIRRLFEHVPDIVIHLAAVAGGIGANRDNRITCISYFNKSDALDDTTGVNVETGNDSFG